MIVDIKFSCDSRCMYIPDGYICNLNKVHLSFFDWLENQPDCITVSPGWQYGITFDAYDFLRYLNTEILKDMNEKAYFVERKGDKSDIYATLYF